MKLSPIMREAIGRIRENADFVLLDCLELLERKESGAIAIMRHGGNTLIGYRVDDPTWQSDECEACGGDGEIPAIGANDKTHSVECPECDGSGAGGGTDVGQIMWQTLNGDPIITYGPLKPIGIADAVFIVAAAQKLIDARAAVPA